MSIGPLEKARIVTEVARDWWRDDGISFLEDGNATAHDELDFWDEVEQRQADAEQGDSVELAAWHEDLHPRDHHGRFARVPGSDAPKRWVREGWVTFQVPGRQRDAVRVKVVEAMDVEKAKHFTPHVGSTGGWRSQDDANRWANLNAMLTALNGAERVEGRGATASHGYRVHLPVPAAKHVHEVLKGSEVGATRRDLEQGMRNQYGQELNARRAAAAAEVTTPTAPAGDVAELLAAFDAVDHADPFAMPQAYETVKAVGAQIAQGVKDDPLYDRLRRAKDILDHRVGGSGFFMWPSSEPQHTVVRDYRKAEAFNEVRVLLGLDELPLPGPVMGPGRINATLAVSDVRRHITKQHGLLVTLHLERAGVVFRQRPGIVRGSGRGAVQLKRAVAEYVPRAWQPREAVGSVRVIRGRAGYRESGGAGGLAQITFRESDLTAQVHEYMHHVDYFGPEYVRQAAAFHLFKRYEPKSRIKPLREFAGNGFAHRSEVAIDDEFAHPYMGRIYPGRDIGGIYRDINGVRRIRGASHELMTVGMEGALFDEYEMWRKDPDSVNFMLGLAVATGRQRDVDEAPLPAPDIVWDGDLVRPR